MNPFANTTKQDFANSERNVGKPMKMKSVKTKVIAQSKNAQRDTQKSAEHLIELENVGLKKTVPTNMKIKTT